MLSNKSLSVCAVLMLLVPALANAQSVQITGVSPTGPITPGSTVNFIAAPTGFGTPSYAVADSYSGTGATVGTIDTVGYFTWTPTIYDGGWHAITVTVTDAANHAASSTVNIRVASTAVLVTNLNPGSFVSVSKPVSFTLTAPGFTTPKYTVYDTSWRSTITPANTSAGTFTWIPTADDVGTHTLAITASDPYGNYAQGTQTITVVRPAVSIDKLSPGTAASVGGTVSFVASAGMLGTTTTYAVTDSFAGTSTVSANAIRASGAFSWVPAASDLGSHTLTVTATDGYGNAASSTVTVLVTAAPAVTAAAPAANVPASVSHAAAPAVPAGYLFTTTLALGSRGAAVTALQNRLTALGLYAGPVTGYFGPMTAVSVRKFQKLHGLAQVGFVGPGTRAVLNK